MPGSSVLTRVISSAAAAVPGWAVAAVGRSAADPAGISTVTWLPAMRGMVAAAADNLTGLSKTDIVNRALSLCEYLKAPAGSCSVRADVSGCGNEQTAVVIWWDYTLASGTGSALEPKHFFPCWS